MEEELGGGGSEEDGDARGLSPLSGGSALDDGTGGSGEELIREGEDGGRSRRWAWIAESP